MGKKKKGFTTMRTFKKKFWGGKKFEAITGCTKKFPLYPKLIFWPQGIGAPMDGIEDSKVGRKSEEMVSMVLGYKGAKGRYWSLATTVENPFLPMGYTLPILKGKGASFGLKTQMPLHTRPLWEKKFGEKNGLAPWVRPWRPFWFAEGKNLKEFTTTL